VRRIGGGLDEERVEGTRDTEARGAKVKRNEGRGDEKGAKMEVEMSGRGWR